MFAKKWPEQCSIKHVNREAASEFLWLCPNLWLTQRFARVDKNNGKDHPLHLRECLLHFHLFFNYLFCMLIFVISLELLKMTWEGGKILWFLSLIFITQSISKKIWKRKLKKMKKLFSQSKVTTHCSLHPVVNWFGIWGKRSHWPCVLESLLLWGKSWVRLFILMTFNFYFFYTALFSQSQG